MCWCLAVGKDAESRARTRSQVEYFVIPYTSTSIRLLHLCQRYHCLVTANDGNMGMLGGGSFMFEQEDKE